MYVPILSRFTNMQREREKKSQASNNVALQLKRMPMIQCTQAGVAAVYRPHPHHHPRLRTRPRTAGVADTETLPLSSYTS
jgi:hypothetical protein